MGFIEIFVKSTSKCVQELDKQLEKNEANGLNNPRLIFSVYKNHRKYQRFFHPLQFSMDYNYQEKLLLDILKEKLDVIDELKSKNDHNQYVLEELNKKIDVIDGLNKKIEQFQKLEEHFITLFGMSIEDVIKERQESNKNRLFGNNFNLNYVNNLSMEDQMVNKQFIPPHPHLQVDQQTLPPLTQQQHQEKSQLIQQELTDFCVIENSTQIHPSQSQPSQQLQQPETQKDLQTINLQESSTLESKQEVISIEKTEKEIEIEVEKKQEDEAIVQIEDEVDNNNNNNNNIIDKTIPTVYIIKQGEFFDNMGTLLQKKLKNVKIVEIKEDEIKVNDNNYGVKGGEFEKPSCILYAVCCKGARTDTASDSSDIKSLRLKVGNKIPIVYSVFVFGKISNSNGICLDVQHTQESILISHTMNDIGCIQKNNENLKKLQTFLNSL